MTFMNCVRTRCYRTNARHVKVDARPSTPRERARLRCPGSVNRSTIQDRRSSSRLLELSRQYSRTMCAHTIKLCSGKHNNPVVSRGIVVDELLEDIATHRASSEDGQDFEGDDRRVRRAPAEIGCGVLFPCLGNAPE
jgi:hypothetical protein